MTVEELRELLRDYPQHAKVYFSSLSGPEKEEILKIRVIQEFEKNDKPETLDLIFS